ncbi:hypothetical protein ACNTMW_31025 [Planosporangium sp. 12N6]|uniref:hypothetical protein n=1 Tax=Planosporangium spinosum TaxID=3402278 RepID=UPI003CF53461
MGIFDLGVLWLLIWLIKNAAMDISYAVKGTPNPRYELKKTRARAAGQAAPAQPRYGTRDWFADLLSDGLQAQTEWRRRRAAARATDRAELVETADAEPAKPTEPAVPGGQKPAGRPAERPEQVPASGPAAAAPAVQTSEPTAGGAAGAEQTPQPRQEQPAAVEPTAKVIPFPTSKENDVTTEVIGLDQSIAYAKSLAQFAGEHGAAGNEGYIGHLTSSKVSGAALASAHEMQEAFANAQAAAERHAGELEKQKSVQEQYDANPDAGDKDYQQQGR